MTTPALALANLSNFRDASGSGPAGYAAGAGTMRRGVVFRSDNAFALAASDVENLRALTLSQAFDLRSASERRRVASVFSSLGATTQVREFDDLTSFNEGELAAKLLTTLVRARDVTGLMELYYRQLPAVFANPIGTICDRLLDADDGAIVVHCRGGKDRTGFSIAMLHRAIGVSAEDALADYLLSAGLFHPGAEEDAMLDGIARRTGVRLAPEALAPMMTVSSAFLEAAYAAIDAHYGGVDAYLAGACGLDDARRARLAEKLTTRG